MDLSEMELNKIYQGDTLEVLKTFPDESIDCIVTSPPYYGLRDYGVEGQIGLEKSLAEYLDRMLLITLELKRVLKKTGTMWWNHGDSYSTSHETGSTDEKKGWTSATEAFSHAKKGRANGGDIPTKSLMLQAHRLAIRMIDEQGWILRNQIIWHKPNCMPSSVKDRFTVDYEPVFFFTKSKRYWFEQQFENSTERTYKPFNLRVPDAEKSKSHQYKASEAEKIKYADKSKMAGGGSTFAKGHSGNYRLDGTYIGTPGKRSMRSVWKIPTAPFPEAHFATFPEKLIETPIKAGCPEGGVCLDPFMGSGTVASVARYLGRNYVGIELNPEYIKIAEDRLSQSILSLDSFKERK